MRNNSSELLPIVVQESNALIDSRLLHKRLKVATKLGTWFQRRVDEYGFEAGRDYFPNLGSKHGRGGHNATDYLLTLDMAKELAMVERNETGRAIRRYFIEKEKELRCLVQQPPAARLFQGIKAKMINDRPMFPYREMLIRCGYKANNNGNRRHRYWMHFVKDGDKLLITDVFALHLYNQKQLMQNRVKLRDMQPVLPLDFGTSKSINLHH